MTPDPADRVDVDERDLLALNYTSGTTGRPKGVMYHNSGAYLQAVAMAYHARLGPGTRYLLHGSIRIESAGETHDYGPGEPWFESGPEPVLATA